MVSGSHGEAYASAARPTADPPMTAPAKTILATLIAAAIGGVRCGPFIRACCSLLYNGPAFRKE